MCGTVVLLECIDVPSDLVSVDTYKKWLQGISLSQDIDKVTCVFHYSFVGKFELLIFEFFILRWFMIGTWYYSMISSNVPKVSILYK